jgi:ureidoacrylate peracid hydrolase
MEVSMRTQIQAKPFPFALDPARAAVLVVDMQNDFGSEGGMFHRAGIDISAIQRTVAPTAAVLGVARSIGMKVIYLKMAFRPDLSDAGGTDSPNRTRHLYFGVGQAVTNPAGGASRILIRDTWNTDIVPELAPQTGDGVVYKHRFSGFYETDLDEILKKAGIDQLVVTGCTTSVCVESTIRDAMYRDYSCLLLSDCCAEPIGDGLPRSNHAASLLTIETLFGWVAESSALLHVVEEAGLSMRSYSGVPLPT